MNERIKQLAEEATVYQMRVYQENGVRTYGEREQVFSKEKFAELIVRDCANYVRENYDHEAAESIAWTMEIYYGLHGDYA